jgi:hypothetical protein
MLYVILLILLLQYIRVYVVNNEDLEICQKANSLAEILYKDMYVIIPDL